MSIGLCGGSVCAVPTDTATALHEVGTAAQRRAAQAVRVVTRAVRELRCRGGCRLDCVTDLWCGAGGDGQT